MKISVSTLNILKNFSKINPSIVVSEGNVLRTISPSSNILAKATVETSFSKKFAIYSIDRFLATASLFDDAEYDFKDSFVEISSGDRKTKYVYAEESLIKKAPENIKFPAEDVSFELSEENLKSVEKAAAVLQLPNLVVTGKDDKLFVQAIDVKNDGGDCYEIAIGETDKTFRAVFKVENIKILPGAYKVDISSKGISRFSGSLAEYYIAVEQNSTF
jgi:hypothetical protein